jgi:hypothetical protein
VVKQVGLNSAAQCSRVHGDRVLAGAFFIQGGETPWAFVIRQTRQLTWGYTATQCASVLAHI